MDMNTVNKVAALYRAIKEIADGADAERFTVRQLLALLAVGARGRPVPQSELVHEFDVEKSAISKVIGVLASDSGVRRGGLGLIDVELSPEDLRSRELTLSSAGEKLLQRACKKAFP